MSESLSWFRGDKYVRKFKETRADAGLTGATIRMMFRRTHDGAVVISKSLGAGLVITSDVPGNREVELTVLPAETNTTTFSLTRDTTLLWDLEITYISGDGPFTGISGTAVVKPDVTR